MASIMIHLQTAHRLLQPGGLLFQRVRDPGQYYLGVTAPDSVNLDGFASKEIRWAAHLRAKTPKEWYQNIEEFYQKRRKKADPDFAIYNGDDVMLLPTIVQGAMGLVSGGSHIFGPEVRAIFKAFAEGDNEKAKELFVPMYRFCKSTGQNGRILPNSILRPAIEAVTGIKVGPARSPLAPATQEEMDITLGILREIGKL